MAGFDCRCGYTIASRAPSRHAGDLIWQADKERCDRLRRRQWTELLEAKAQGKYLEWVRVFYGHANSPADPVSVPPMIDVLEDIELRADTVSRAVVHCPECGRLYVERSQGASEYDCYQLEPER